MAGHDAGREGLAGFDSLFNKGGLDALNLSFQGITFKAGSSGCRLTELLLGSGQLVGVGSEGTSTSPSSHADSGQSSSDISNRMAMLNLQNQQAASRNSNSR